MNGKIEKIIVYAAKGAAGVGLAEARFVENLGIEGDFHAKGGERQVSLLFAESREFDASTEQGLCLKRFKENLKIRGSVSPDIKPGTRLSAGEAVLEISGETKHCHEECALYKAGKRCKLAGLNLFARVVKGGFVRVGESVAAILLIISPPMFSKYVQWR